MGDWSKAEGPRTVLEPWQMAWLNTWHPTRQPDQMMRCLASMMPELSRLNRTLSRMTALDPGEALRETAWGMVL